MRGTWRFLWPALVLIAVGCSGTTPTVTAPAPKLTTSVSLGDLLTKSRSDLATQAAECEEKIHIQAKAHREGKQPFGLLRELRLPFVPPVLHQAKFSASVGFSLPPYIKEGTKDPDLAFHYARFGDLEAARKLIDPGDAESVRRIEGCALGRNYPVEWTRLVGLLMHAAEIDVACGEQDSGNDLTGWHQELTKLLDSKAKQSQLGTVLLSHGRQVLTRAGTAWQNEKQTAIADTIQKTLASWGEVPPPAPLPPGVSRAEVARILQATPETGNRALVAGNNPRALDLLGLPLPVETVDTVLAFWDGQGRLSEILVVFRPRTADLYPRPTDLGLRWDEELGESQQTTDLPGMRRCSWSAGQQSCDVTMIAGSSSVGALARWVCSPSTTSPTLPRSFQVADLDRSFEQNRLQVNPSQRGDTIASDKANVLGNVVQPLADLKPARVTVQREAGQEVTSRLTLTFALDQPPLGKVVLPLWTKWGPARVEGVNDDHGGHLALVWQDGRTECTVRFPYSASEPIQFEIGDGQSSKDPSVRSTQALAQDLAERQARIKAGQPLTRLPRQLEWDQVKLGTGRDDILKALPADGRSILRRDVGDAAVFTFGNDPPRTATLVPRQLVVRFDKAGRVVELRGRYENGPAGKGFKDLVASLQKKGGAAAESSGWWTGLWKGKPERKPAAQLSTWKDDLTLLTCQTDATGAEIVLRDWPANLDSPPPLPALEALPRGPESCVLGDKRDDLLTRWKVTKPEMAGEALLLRPATVGRYDVLLVYFDGDVVNRVVARQVLPAKQAPTQPVQLAAALMDVWGRDTATFGWPRRQDTSDKNVVSALGWHDDRTQIWLFWQEATQGPPRIYTEWKDVPSSTK